MIKRISSSLTVRIFLLMSGLLTAACGLTYMAVAHFLPVTYSNRLRENLDLLSREMADTIGQFSSVDEAAETIELFEAGAKVSVFLLDESGNLLWPPEETVYEGAAFDVTQENIVQGTVYEEAVFDVTQENIVQETAYEEAVSDVTQENIMRGTDLQGNAVQKDIMQDSVREKNTAADAEETRIEAEEGVTDRSVGLSQEAAAEKETEGGTDIFADSSAAMERYEVDIGDVPCIMLVSGGMQPVNQAAEILKEIFPYILILSLVIALGFSWCASWFLTAPVIALCRLSRKMAVLDFSEIYRGKRRDEIGILGRDLNQLSENLLKALNDLQEANSKLKTEIEMERELDRQRLAFFSAVSHELKTPITILEGHLTGMLEGVGEYKNRDYYLCRSRDTVWKMRDMVMELLTVSRMENKPLSMKKTDLAELLRLSLAELTEFMESRRMELVLELPDHCWKNANAPMMEKVFRNFIVNAVRYSPEGNQIRIDMKETEEQISFSIENTGASVPQEDMPHLFEAFYRVEQSRSRMSGGSGLGLYIVRMVLEQHGAVYGAENTGEGVRFYFSF